jgi:hypothetical protein
MISWILQVDSWGFPIVNTGSISTISTGIRIETTGDSEEELQPVPGTEIPYSDASEYPWLFDPNYRPPDRGDEELEREFETWERTRPEEFDDIYYDARYEEDYDREAEFLEEWSRAMAL